MAYEMAFVVPESKTVPYVYEDSPEFQAMPRVFATAFLVGLFERACIEALRPHLDWPDELTVGTRIEITHTAPTPPGFTVTVQVRLVEIDGRRLVFDVMAGDDADQISQGRHERHLVKADSFVTKANAKARSHLGRPRGLQGSLDCSEPVVATEHPKHWTRCQKCGGMIDRGSTPARHVIIRTPFDSGLQSE